jgi:lipoprotein-anchoring transpeptidase ErfK/SrfK
MSLKGRYAGYFLATLTSLAITGCSSVSNHSMMTGNSSNVGYSANYADRIPSHINTGGQKVVVVDPRVHVWGAYDANGNLVRAGLASAGANWCPDIQRPCRTTPGSFRVNSLGSPDCKSSRYPIPNGGAPMPYCMYFNNHQALHGSAASNVVEGNVSHGCVRLRVSDAEWLRYNFVNVGTRVIIKPY